MFCEYHTSSAKVEHSSANFNKFLLPLSDAFPGDDADRVRRRLHQLRDGGGEGVALGADDVGAVGLGGRVGGGQPRREKPHRQEQRGGSAAGTAAPGSPTPGSATTLP